MDRLPLPYTSPTAAALFIAACLVWLLPEAIGMLPQMARVSRQGAAIQDRSSLAVLLGLQWAGLALNFWLAWRLPQAAMLGPRTAVFALGLLCIPLGTGLRWSAIRRLGSYFTRDVAVSPGQPVVQDGPYRLVRHPAYSGTFLTMLGVGLAMTNWASLACLLLCVFAGHFYRVKVEEAALLRLIGDPYRAYMQCTKRFIPWVF